MNRHDRPAEHPERVRCTRCQRLFVGARSHLFCGLCIGLTAEEISEAQGEVVKTDPGAH